MLNAKSNEHFDAIESQGAEITGFGIGAMQHRLKRNLSRREDTAHVMAIFALEYLIHLAVVAGEGWPTRDLHAYLEPIKPLSSTEPLGSRSER